MVDTNKICYIYILLVICNLWFTSHDCYTVTIYNDNNKNVKYIILCAGWWWLYRQHPVIDTNLLVCCAFCLFNLQLVWAILRMRFYQFLPLLLLHFSLFCHQANKLAHISRSNVLVNCSRVISSVWHTRVKNTFFQWLIFLLLNILYHLDFLYLNEQTQKMFVQWEKNILDYFLELNVSIYR